MDPWFPDIEADEDPLVARARGRMRNGDSRPERLSMATAKYFFVGFALVVFMVFFVGGIWLCMELLHTGMEKGDWYLGF